MVSHRLQHTWMANRKQILAIHNYVQSNLARDRCVRPRRREDIAACTVDVLSADLDTFCELGRWFG